MPNATPSGSHPSPRIFVSHSHEDDAFCRKLVADLRAHLGEDAVWYDTSGGLHGGDVWWDKIVAEITERTYFLVVLSPAAVASRWVSQEMGIAFRQYVEFGKRLLPVRLTETPRRADWGGIQEFNFISPRTYEDALAEVLAALHIDASQRDATVSNVTPTSAPSPRQTLLQALDRQADLLARLHMNTAARNMRRLAEFTNGPNRVMVVGEFNRGKSTLINALLGMKALPTGAMPATAVLTEVRWGEQPRASLYRLPPKDSSEQIIDQVSIDDLTIYLVASDEGEREKSYEKLVLELPAEVCREGIEFVDTPANVIRNFRDQDYRHLIDAQFERLDALLYVVASDFPLARGEIDTMRAISGNLRDGELFFVCGRIDQVDEEEVARAKRRLTQILAPLTQQGERRVYFVDARAALRARMEHNDARAQESGIQALEQDLKAFLSANRSRVKLARAAAGLQDSIREARLSIRENAQHAADDKMREISDALDAQDMAVRDMSRALALDT